MAMEVRKVAPVAKPEKTGEVIFTVGGQEITLKPETVKRYLVSGDAEKVTMQECVMFIQMCKFNGLNPWLKEAYMIKYGNSPAQMIPGKEAFLKRAERNPEYRGMECGVVIFVKEQGEVIKREGAAVYKELGEELIGGWAKVYRADRDIPFYSEVSIGEYTTGKSKWGSSPATMIRKVAMVQALREAFPTDLGAMYAAEEQGVEEPAGAVVEVEAEEAAAPAEPAGSIVVDDGDPFEE